MINAKVIRGINIEAPADGWWHRRVMLPIMRCPTETRHESNANSFMWSYKPSIYLFGFPAGTGGTPTDLVLRMTKITEIRQPTQTVALAESFYGQPNIYKAFVSIDGNGNSGHGWNVRHGRTANFLFMDGHVDTFRYNGSMTKTWPAVWCLKANWETAAQNLLWKREGTVAQNGMGLVAKW